MHTGYVHIPILYIYIGVCVMNGLDPLITTIVTLGVVSLGSSSWEVVDD